MTLITPVSCHSITTSSVNVGHSTVQYTLLFQLQSQSNPLMFRMNHIETCSLSNWSSTGASTSRPALTLISISTPDGIPFATV